MSSHVRIAATLLGFVAVLSAAGAAAASHQLTDLLECTESVRQSLTAGGTGEALDTLETEWSHAQKWLRLMLPDSTLSELNTEIGRLRCELDAQPDAVSGALAAVSAELAWLRQRQYPLLF